MTDLPPVIPYRFPPTYTPSIRRPRVWTTFVTFGVVIVGGIAATVVVLIVAMAFMGVTKENSAHFDVSDLLINPRVFLAMAAGMQMTVLGTVAGACLLSPVPTIKRLRLGPSNTSWLSIAIFAAGAVGLSQFCSTMIEALHWEMGTIKYISDALINLSPKLVIVAVVVIGILPGIAEEALCRGYIQTRLSQRWGRAISILVTALLFAILHMDPLQSTFAFGLGIYLGLITERTGSLRPAMICHMVNNTLVVLSASVAAEGLQVHVAGMLIGSALVLTGAVIYLLRFFPAINAPPLPEAFVAPAWGFTLESAPPAPSASPLPPA